MWGKAQTEWRRQRRVSQERFKVARVGEIGRENWAFLHQSSGSGRGQTPGAPEGSESPLRDCLDSARGHPRSSSRAEAAIGALQLGQSTEFRSAVKHNYAK